MAKRVRHSVEKENPAPTMGAIPSASWSQPAIIFPLSLFGLTCLSHKFVAGAPPMGLDARRGAGFPPERYETTSCEEGQSSPNETAGSITQAAGERLCGVEEWRGAT